MLENISLDGVIQTSGEHGDFSYGDWTAPYRTPAGREAIIAAQGERFDLLLSSPMADGSNATPSGLIVSSYTLAGPLNTV